MSQYNIVVATDESTVVSEYVPEYSVGNAYQSEAELEREFIRLLTEQGYGYLPIHTEAELVANLRAQLELLIGSLYLDAIEEAFELGWRLRSDPTPLIFEETHQSEGFPGKTRRIRL